MDKNNNIIDRINSPRDLDILSCDELKLLAEEIRDMIKETLSERGGHLATNLGIVELTIALHRTFEFKRDRIVFDVGHQCYTHKIITGRRDRFQTLRVKNGLSGYPNSKESEYDSFNAGHAGPSISAALGLICGDSLIGTKRKVVVVIGDGSIPSGLALEGLNQLGHLRKNLIIVLNDNEMSISKTVGALSSHLTSIRTGAFYNKNKERFQNVIKRLPLGKKVKDVTEHLATNLVNTILPGQFFEELGIRYFGPLDGHSIEELERVLKNCRDLDGPILVHAITTKGHGYSPAKEDPESYHGASPFYIHDGSSKQKNKGISYSTVFAETLIEEAKHDSTIVAITAAMPLGTGLTEFSKKYPERLFDVGISEQHAITFAGGLSKAGMKPVVAIYSTFLQRGFDQIFHDISMQDDIHVVFAIDRAGLVGSDGFSHHGVFDIALLRVLPGMILMAPRDKQELTSMMQYALKHPAIYGIRYPREIAPIYATENYSVEKLIIGKSVIVHKGKKIAILAYGSCVQQADEAVKLLKENNITCTLVNARFAKPLDGDMIVELSKTHDALITIEEHMRAGGFGSAVLEYCADHGITWKEIRLIAIEDRYIAHASRLEQLKEVGLDTESIVRKIQEVWESL